MSQLAANGGQPQKAPKFADIYNGRFFNGINTNRSPLRAASASHIYEKFYSDNSGDALIAGSNIEISNRLTLTRRPGNPLYDTTVAHTYNDPDSFDEFRVNKAQSDVFNNATETPLENIFTMIDEGGSGTKNLYSLTSDFQRGGDSGYHLGLKFQKAISAGQAFMQAVGNSLYFGDGVDNKKWLQSLFTRTSAGNNTFLQGTDGRAGTYPFGTFMLDPATGNIQQFIGISIGRVSHVNISNNVMTLTVTLSPDTNDYAVGTDFQLYGFTNATFLNGATIELSQQYTHGVSTTFMAPFEHADYDSAEAGQNFIIQAGTTPVIAETGSSVPTYGTTTPSSANDFMGSLTSDGNTVWINRGENVENWGINAPTTKPTFSVQGSEQSWQASTYYSPASIYIDNNAGYLWQIMTAGKTGAVQPSWPGSPTPRQKVVISSVAIASNVATFITDTQSPALVAGDTVQMSDMDVASFLNGQKLTVLSSGLTTTGFKANFTFTGTYAATPDYGLANKIAGTGGPTQVTDGTAVWLCIQTPASLTWAAHKHYDVGDFLVITSGGQQQFMELGSKVQPFVNGAISTTAWTGNPSFAGQFDKAFPAPAGDFTLPSALGLHWAGATGQNTQMYAVNGAGEAGSATDSGHYEEWEASIRCNMFIPQAGQYTFTLTHDDGGFFAFDSSTGAYRVSGTGNNILGNVTAVQGYPFPSGNNVSGANTDSATWFFPTAGNYGLEICWKNWEHASTMIFSCPGPTGQDLAVGRDESGTTQPVWPGFTTSGASYDTVNKRIVWGGSVVEIQTAGQQYIWNNIGFVTDFLWQANTPYTLPGTNVIDSNSNQEGAYETGISGTTQPTWGSTINSITADTNPPLKWINEGSVPAVNGGGNTITATSTQGWLYYLALVNTLDNTVSNLGPVSAPTGQVIKGQITFGPGAGLDINTIDPQADYVAIFRTTDGGSIPLLIPGFVNSPYTVPLTQYLRYGYVDTVPDVELNNLIQGARAGENTPPAKGAINLTYHLNRIWYSIGNTVFWTTGPLTPVGNGIDGTAPRNYASCPSQVKRLVPTAIGMLAFTVSDIYIIAGNGTISSAILPAIPYLTGVGLGSYNALDVNGGLIGFFTTDKQFVVFDPSAGLSYVGFNIGDQFRLNNGKAGQSWRSQNVYVSWYINGEDAAWYVADGTNGWYRVIQTPAPESGSVAWSPFATIAAGAGAIGSIETSPGVHNLLTGQTTGSSVILMRDIDATTDGGSTGSNGTTYSAYGVLGSIVLAQPGQIAKIAFITTDSVNVGSPLIIGVIIDEALPYYKGSFDILKRWETDPPNLPKSTSILSQRFYLAELADGDQTAYCKHLQILFQWPPEAAQNELQTFSIFGAYEIEQ